MAINRSKSRSNLDLNLVVDPGFGYVKIARRDAQGNFVPTLFPNVVSIYSHRISGLLDERTVKVTIKSTTIPGISTNECRLVGNRATLTQQTGKHTAYDFPKVAKEILVWSVFAAYSYLIPPNLKSIKIKDYQLGCLLQNINEASELKQTLAGEHVFELQRSCNGVIDTVEVQLSLEKDKIFVFQEASCAINYVLENNLCSISHEEGSQVANISIGVGTVDYLRQDSEGNIIDIISQDKLGVSSLASLVSAQLVAMNTISSPQVDKILRMIGERSGGSKFIYGKGSSAIDISDVFSGCLKTWCQNIIRTYINLWDEDFPWIEKIFLYGGGVHHLGITHKPEPIFLFTEPHDPQFVDVWGAKIYLEGNN